MESKTINVSQHLLDALLDVEKVKYCYECGICTASCPIVELVPQHYHPRSLLQRVLLDLNNTLKEEGPWLCAWCYRCYRRCPQGLKLPEIFLAVKDLAAERSHLEGFSKALQTIKKELPLPAICSWVCFHSGRGEVKKPQVFSGLRHFLAEYKLEEKAWTVPKTRPEKIAIIGSGPAGLTAACELTKNGYSVTVFESSSETGGMLRRCMPGYRLPRDVLDIEIEHTRNMGVEIRTNTTIGKDVTLTDLSRDGYEAVFIAIGTHESRKLGIEGEELKGAIQALGFLSEINSGKDVKLGDRVAVIGGGNVAMDTARTALMLGAKEVSVLYRRSKADMPANPWEVKEAEDSGVEILFLIAPKKILGKNGQVAALECVRMELGEPDESGRRRPIPIEGSEFIMNFDTIILAIGETPDLSFLPKEIEISERNTIVVDPSTMETTQRGVFAGGDAVLGAATVIEAIVAGKRAASTIDRYLRRHGKDDK